MRLPGAVGVSVRLPLVACFPLQAPEAVQAVVLIEDQLSLVESPRLRLLAASDSTGGPGGSSASAATASTKP